MKHELGNGREQRKKEGEMERQLERGDGASGNKDNAINGVSEG